MALVSETAPDRPLPPPLTGPKADGAKYRPRYPGAMYFTATQRFVFLALHVAHQGDDEVQAEEQAALTEAARRIGATAEVPPSDVDAWVQEALDVYLEAVQDGMLDQLVEDSVEALGDLDIPVRQAVLQELRTVAMAADGVNRDEHVWIDDLRAAWGVDLLA